MTVPSEPSARLRTVSLACALGRLEAVRLDVGRLHAGAAVEHHDGVDDLLGLGHVERPRHREDQRADQQQLEDQQDAPVEPLPRLVGREVAQQILPEVGAADLELLAADLQQVEEDQDRDQDAERQPQRRQEAHRRTPRRRRWSKRTTSRRSLVWMRW